MAISHNEHQLVTLPCVQFCTDRNRRAGERRRRSAAGPSSRMPAGPRLRSGWVARQRGWVSPGSTPTPYGLAAPNTLRLIWTPGYRMTRCVGPAFGRTTPWRITTVAGPSKLSGRTRDSWFSPRRCSLSSEASPHLLPFTRSGSLFEAPFPPFPFAQIVGSRRSPSGLGSDHSTSSQFMHSRSTSGSRSSRSPAERHGVIGCGFEFIRTLSRSPRRRISLIQALRHSALRV